MTAKNWRPRIGGLKTTLTMGTRVPTDEAIRMMAEMARLIEYQRLAKAARTKVAS